MSFFLESVLPSSGKYCVVGIRNKKVQQSFLNSIDEVQQLADALVDKGVDAYIALASFGEEAARTVENAIALRSFFLDLDCGVEKPYAAPEDAAVALKAFIDATGLPQPFIVHSGGGLHVYWMLDNEVPVAEWVPYARALKSLCITNKMGIDPVVTADAARILRIPGTKNFKFGQVRSVEIAVAGEIVPLARILKCLPTPAPVVDLSSARMFGMDKTTAELAGDLPKSLFSRVIKISETAAGCGQIRHALANAATLEEPLWRAALSIAWHCTDAETGIQEVSKGHPGYTAEDTLAKAQLTKGPYTCEWYRNNYAKGCVGCKNTITSPILLGKIIEEAVVENGAYVVEHNLRPDAEATDDAVTTVKVEIPVYEYPYFRGKTGGVCKWVKGEDGVDTETVIYLYDLYITKRFYDSVETGDGLGEVVGINLHLPHDGIRQFYVPITSMLTKDKLRDALVTHGVIAYGTQLDTIMAYLASSVRKLQSQFRANETRSQMGWTPDNKSFVLGECEYTAEGMRLAPPASGTRQLAPLFHPRGTLDAWKKIVDFYDTPGLEAQAFALFAGFGSPLVKFIGGATIKGAMINLVSNKSGTGKTTAQLVVNSIYGHPVDLLMEKADTVHAKFHRLGMMNHLPFTVDETTNMTPEEMSEFIYGISQGRARHRMDSQANKLRVNHATWANITIGSSNKSAIDMLTSLKNSADGELRRIIELQVGTNESISKEFTDALFATLDTNYGIAGPKYVTYILNNMDKVIADLQTMQHKIDKDLKLAQSDRFYSVILACSFVGAMIAQELGFHSINVPRIYRYALKAVVGVKESTQNTNEVPSSNATAMVGSYMNENFNGGLIFTNEEDMPGLPAGPAYKPTIALKFRYERAADEIWIPATALKQYFVDKQVDVKHSMQTMADAGVLKTWRVAGKTAEFVKAKRIAAGAHAGMPAPAVKCYCFVASILGIDPDILTPDADEVSTPA